MLSYPTIRMKDNGAIREIMDKEELRQRFIDDGILKLY